MLKIFLPVLFLYDYLHIKIIFCAYWVLSMLKFLPVFIYFDITILSYMHDSYFISVGWLHPPQLFTFLLLSM